VVATSLVLAGALSGCPFSDNYFLETGSAEGGFGGAGASGRGGAGGISNSGGAGMSGLADAGTGGGVAFGGAAGADAGADGATAARDAGTRELAHNRPVAASSEQTSKGNVAPLGNDGNSTTRWSAADGNTPKWWRVDLGSVHRLSRIEIDWEFARVYGYVIEVSSDDTNYTVIIDRSNSFDSSENQGADVNASGRYVRVTVTALTANPITWASFYEARVYGW
jgi:hypothetical protein